PARRFRSHSPRFHANRQATQSGAVAIVLHGDLKSEQSPVNCCFSLVLPVDHALANNFDAATMSAIGTKRQGTCTYRCLLSGVKRTFLKPTLMSAFDPKRTSGAQNCCCANLP